MKKKMSFLFVSLGALFGVFFAGLKSSPVRAVEFPIAELGYCQNQRECHLYCEVPANKAACWSYGVYKSDTNVLGKESPEQKLAQLGITFPVAELGNCANVTQCKTYCSNAANASSCREYSQSRRQILKEQLIVKAQEELGCSTNDECRKMCALEENRSRCSQFAARWNIRNTVQNRLVIQAQSSLGCSTAAECKTFCSQEENRQKCADFASQMGLQIKQKVIDKIGCSTNEECRKLCEENPDRCPGYPNVLNKPTSSMRPQFTPTRIGTPSPTFKPRASGINPEVWPPEAPASIETQTPVAPTY